ncbi:MAG: hypothetical protein LBS83_01950 [Holosporales bacterium]|jgi:hypothetical protein|nr:hypothetical protein [Holosporales bacterium]
MNFVKKIIGSALLGVCFAGGVFSGEEGLVSLHSGKLDINFGSDLSSPTQALPPSSAKSSNDEHKEEVEDGIKPEESVVENIGGHDDEVAVLEGVDKDKNDANLDLSGQALAQVVSSAPSSDEVPAEVSEKGQEQVSGQVSVHSAKSSGEEGVVLDSVMPEVMPKFIIKDGNKENERDISGVVNASGELVELAGSSDQLLADDLVYLAARCTWLSGLLGYRDQFAALANDSYNITAITDIVYQLEALARGRDQLEALAHGRDQLEALAGRRGVLEALAGRRG